MHPRWKFLSVVAASCIALTSAPAAADDCAASADPAACYLSAAQALRDRAPGEAAKLYLASYRLAPKIDPLAGYGLALALDHQDVRAAEALEKAIEAYEQLEAELTAQDADASTLFALIHRLELVRGELRRLAPGIAWVQLDVPDRQLPAGLTVVRKGGDDLRSSNATKLLVQARGDILVFTYASGRTLELPVNVVGGVIHRVAIPAEPVPVAPPPPVEVPPPSDPGAKLQRYAYLAGGAGAGLLAIGIGHAVIADPSTLSVVLIGGGVLGLGAGAVLWYQAYEQRKPASTALVPVINDQMIGAVFVGRM